jgi:flagellar motor component MotA
MDLTTIIGLVAGLGIVGVVMIMDGGSPAELFAHPSALLLTIVAHWQHRRSPSAENPDGDTQMVMIAFMGNKTKMEPERRSTIFHEWQTKPAARGYWLLKKRARKYPMSFSAKG